MEKQLDHTKLFQVQKQCLFFANIMYSHEVARQIAILIEALLTEVTFKRPVAAVHK